VGLTHRAKPTTVKVTEKWRTTRELIDLTTTLNGRFYLPYQLHNIPEQLERSHAGTSAFFKAKKRYDPDELFTHTFY